MIPPEEVLLTEQAQEILASPELFRVRYEVSVKLSFLLNLLILTVLYAIPVGAFFSPAGHFPTRG